MAWHIADLILRIGITTPFIEIPHLIWPRCGLASFHTQQCPCPSPPHHPTTPSHVLIFSVLLFKISFLNQLFSVCISSHHRSPHKWGASTTGRQIDNKFSCGCCRHSCFEDSWNSTTPNCKHRHTHTHNLPHPFLPWKLEITDLFIVLLNHTTINFISSSRFNASYFFSCYPYFPFLSFSKSNFPHFKKEQLIDFERRFLLKISFQIVPQTTPSAFLRYLLNLWPNSNSDCNNTNSNEIAEDPFRSPCSKRNSNLISTNRHTNVPAIPYKEILVIADTLLGLFWEGTSHLNFFLFLDVLISDFWILISVSDYFCITHVYFIFIQVYLFSFTFLLHSTWTPSVSFPLLLPTFFLHVQFFFLTVILPFFNLSFSHVIFTYQFDLIFYSTFFHSFSLILIPLIFFSFSLSLHSLSY